MNTNRYGAFGSSARLFFKKEAGFMAIYKKTEIRTGV